MKDGSTTNYHYLGYIFLFKRLGEGAFAERTYLQNPRVSVPSTIKVRYHLRRSSLPLTVNVAACCQGYSL